MTEALVQNGADESQTRAADQKEKRGRKRELSDVHFILQTVQGRRFMWRYLAECGVFTSSFTGNSSTFFNEGMRKIGLQLLADVNEASPESYFQMLKENQMENKS